MKFSLKLTALSSLIFLAGSAAVTCSVYTASVGALKDQVTLNMEDHTSHVIREIDRLLFERYADIKVLAGDPVLRSRGSSVESITKRLNEFKEKYELYLSLSCFDMGRKKVADTSSRNLGETHPLDEYWPAIAAGRHTVITVTKSEAAGEAVIYFASLVRDSAGIPFRVVASRVPVRELAVLTGDKSEVPSGERKTKTDLVDRNGLLLYSADTGRILKEVSPVWEPVRRSLASGKSFGVERTGDSAEDDIIFAYIREPGYRDYPGNDWTLITYIPAEAAFVPAIALRNKILLILLVVGAALLSVIALFSRAVSRPIERLSRASADIGKGNFDVEVDISSGDEIGLLGRSFNSMAGDLRERIEKQLKTEEDLRQALAWREAIFDGSMDAVFISDTDSRLSDVNPAACELTGYSGEDLLLMKFQDLHAAGDPAAFRKFLERITTGAQIVSKALLLRKDGGKVSVEFNSRPIIIGTRRYMHTSVRDISERKRVEEALRESEKRYRMLAENVSDVIWTTDMDLRPTYFSPSVMNLLGYTAAEAMSLPIESILTPRSLDVIRESLAGELSREGAARGEIHRRRTLEIEEVCRDGSTIWVEVKADFLRDELGRPCGILGIARDVTERKLMEESLRKSEASLANAQRMAHMGNWDWDIERNEIYWSDETYRIFGLAPRRHPMSYDRFMEFIYPEDKPLVRDALLRSMNGESFFELEYRVIRPDGMTRLLRGRGEAALDDQSSPVRISGTLRDVTEEKASEETLSRQLAAMEASIDGIAILDREWRYIYANRAYAETYGFEDPGEFLGKSWKSVRSEEEGARFEDRIIPEFLEKKHWRGEAAGRKKDGSLFDQEISVTHVDKTGIICIVRDITDRKRAEKEIARLNEELEVRVEERTRELVQAQDELARKEKLALLGQLAGGVGHELRNPLGVISNAVFFLKTVLSERDGVVTEYLDIIKSELDISLQIISDLLDFARTGTPQTGRVRVGELIARCISKCSIPEDIAVRIDIPGTLPILKVDPIQMAQVFRNLITNAVQAMPDGGKLLISARSVESSQFQVKGFEEQQRGLGTLNDKAPGDLVEISVTDTGEGISPGSMKKLFHPLFTTRARGIGLGLVVSKKLTEANGGSIEAGNSPNGGARVTLLLPAQEETEK